MKKLKKMLVLILATILLCFTLTGCGNLSATVQTYKFDEWFNNKGYVYALKEGLTTETEEVAGGVWENISETARKYTSLLAGINSSLMNADNKLISISMKIVAETDGQLYFFSKSNNVSGVQNSNLRQASVGVKAGQEHIVSFEYNMPITNIFWKAVTGGGYMLEVACTKLVAYDNYNEVPIGAPTRNIGGTNYYLDYSNLVDYKITALTFVFEIEK